MRRDYQLSITKANKSESQTQKNTICASPESVKSQMFSHGIILIKLLIIKKIKIYY